MQYACIALLCSSDAELEDKRDHYDRVGKRESDDRSGRIPLKSGGLDSLVLVNEVEESATVCRVEEVAIESSSYFVHHSFLCVNYKCRYSHRDFPPLVDFY